MAHDIVLTKEHQCRGFDWSVPENVDAGVKVVHRLGFKDGEVQQAYLFNQSLEARKDGFSKT